MLSDVWERVKSTVREGIDWVSETWAVKTLAGIARDVVAPVADLIGDQLADLIAWLSDAVDAILHLILTPIRAAWDFLAPRVADFLHALPEFFDSVFQGLLNIIRVRIPAALRWASERIATVRDAVLGVVDGVRRWAVDRVRDLVRGLNGLRQWVVDNILRPLGEKIAGLTRWAAERIGDLLERLDGLRQWVVDRVLTPLWERVTGIVRLIAGRIMAAVRLVEAAWSVFQAILRFGPAAVLALMLPGRAGQLFRHLVRSTAGEATETVGALDDLADIWLR